MLCTTACVPNPCHCPVSLTLLPSVAHHIAQLLTMSSGFSVKGGKGRCFDFWNDFSTCMVRA